MEMIDFSKIILLKILQNIKKYYIIKYESNYKKGIMIIDIVSASNAKYKYIKSLKKFRTKNKEYTVEGIKSVHDAIASQREISMIAVSEGFFSKMKISIIRTYPNRKYIISLRYTKSAGDYCGYKNIKNFKPEKDKAQSISDG